MKTPCKALICLFCLIACAPPLWAKDKYVVAVLPFSVSSSENIDFIRQGIANIIASRLSVNEKIDVIGKDKVLAALPESRDKEFTAAELAGLGKKFTADFIVSGSITKIGSSLSIDGKLFDTNAEKTAFAVSAQCQSMDEVIPKVNDLTQRIEAQISGTPQQMTSATPASKEIIVSRQKATPTPQANRDAEIISGMKSGKKGTFTSLINPDFINAEQPLNKDTFWKSQQFPYEVKGMDIGDVNGDGLNETVIIDQSSVFVYQKKGTEFTLLQQIKGRAYDSYLAVDVADINGNGIKEIVVSNYYNQQVDSFVIEYQKGKYSVVASGLPWFLRVIATEAGTGVLLGQRLGMNEIFENPIFEIVWKNGEYREGAKMKIPEGLSVYGLAFVTLNPGGPERIVSLGADDFLSIFEKTDKPLSKITIFGGSDEFIWKSEDVYGGTNTYIAPLRQPNSSVLATEDLKQNTYINLRILTYDTNKDGKKEIIIVKNASSTGRVFQNVKFFTSGEIYDLEWDSLGMVENWRTKKINGYVSDYQFKDIDNDGENEIVLSLVISVGGTLRGRSMIVAYELKGP